MRSRLFTHTCDVRRKVAVGNAGKRQQQTHLTGLACLATPMTSRVEIEHEFTVGSGYDFYFPDPATDVKSGDQLTYAGSTFNVRAAHPYQVPRIGHLHVLATREGA